MLKHRKQTPHDLWKARKDKEERELLAHLPPGLINHGNTCFMNSVLQGLIATPDLYDLVHFIPLQPSSSRQISPSLSPQLTNGLGLGGHADHEWTQGMPLGDVFIRIMYNAWTVQDNRTRESLSPRDLLTLLGQKHDQYLDFRQQDAHEFLRYLLDAIRMDESDIIKQRQPPRPKERKRKSRPSRRPPDVPASAAVIPEIDQDQKLESFVDVLFGGKLTSFLVCGKCKHISRTYEDFNDLSLSIKPEDFDKDRKRNTLKTLAKKFGLRQQTDGATELPPRPSSVPPSPIHTSFNRVSDDTPDPRRRSHELVPNIPKDLDGAQASEVLTINNEQDSPVHTEIAEQKREQDEVRVEFLEPEKEQDREDDGWVRLKLFSKSVGKRAKSKSRERSVKSSKPKYGEEGLAPNNGDTTDTCLTSRSPSPEPSDAPLPAQTSWPSPLDLRRIKAKRRKLTLPPKLSRGETAYLRHILADVAPASANPFAMFRTGATSASVPGSSSSSSGTNLWAKFSQFPGAYPSVEECLRWFTSVEMLDGENMVGCRQCWKMANGMDEADEEQSDNEDSDTEDALNLTGVPSAVPSLSVPHSDVLSPQSSPEPYASSSPTYSSVPSITDEPSTEHPSSATSLSTSFEVSTPKVPPPAHDGGPYPTPTSSPVSNPPSIYVGMPIPTISTTAPESATSPTPSPPASMDDLMYGLPSTTLSAPKVLRRRTYRKTNGDASDVSSDNFDETESEASLSDTSSIASPVVSPNASQEQLDASPAPEAEGSASPPKPSSKTPRSKQVIMRRCYKRYLISDPPPVLVIHLKRFQQTSRNLVMTFSSGFKKLDDYVSFPENLDLTPFLAPKKEDFGLSSNKGKKKVDHKSEKTRCMYRLYAVVVHIGNMLGGHYIAYTALPSGPAANTPTVAMSSQATASTRKGEAKARQWAYISDTIVKLTTLEEVLKSKAYICMYERIA